MTRDQEEIIRERMKPGCICKGIKLHTIRQAIEEGADSYEAIARKTGIGGGSCESKRCAEKIEQLLAEKSKK